MLSSTKLLGSGGAGVFSRCVPIVRFVAGVPSSTRDTKLEIATRPADSSAGLRPGAKLLPDNSRRFCYHSILLSSKHPAGIKHPSQSSNRFLHISSRRSAPDPYSVLGLSRDASAHDIKKRYRELAKKYHPDVNSGPEASAKMAGISSAYQVLSDPKQKQFFDQTGMSPEEAGVNQAGEDGRTIRLWLPTHNCF